MNFLREKFTELIIFLLFLILLALWVQAGYNEALRDFVTGSFGALLAALGLRPRPNTTNVDHADNIKATLIDTAQTQTGDIIGRDIKNSEIENERNT